MRKIVERALRQAGLELLEVHEAGSGVEGLEVLKAQPVDLILSDINMPTMDGLEFVRQIRTQNLAEGFRGDDHDRIERGTRQAGDPGRGAGIHPQAVYGGAGEGTGTATGGRVGTWPCGGASGYALMPVEGPAVLRGETD